MSALLLTSSSFFQTLANHFPSPWILLSLLGLILLNAFFVAAQYALVKTRKHQLGKDSDSPGYRRETERYRKNLTGYLTTTQVGISGASILIGMVFVYAVLPALGEAGARRILISLTLLLGLGSLLIVLGELTPKYLAIRRPLLVIRLIRWPLRIFYILFLPLTFLLDGSAKLLLKWGFRLKDSEQTEFAHSAEEIRRIVTESGDKEVMTETEREILINALELNDVRVRSIMQPRNEVVCLDTQDDFEENLGIAVSSKHTRYPLIDGHLDTTLGVIHIKDVIEMINGEKKPLEEISRPIGHVPETMPVDELLRHFRRQSAHMAIVVDEYGGSLGIVTLEDVLEEVVGDLNDEFHNADEDEPEFERINSEEFFVEGTLSLHELEEHCELEWETPDVSTVGGYVIRQLGHIPEEGESVLIESYRVTVEEMDSKRIERLRFVKLNPSEPKPVTAESPL